MYCVAWLTGKSAFVDDHFHGHAWAYLLGFGDEGAIWFDVIGQCLIVLGAVLAIVGWRQIHRAKGKFVATGVYRYVRHPQYSGFFLFLIGSLVNWPTLPTLMMFPILLVAYYRLALHEERVVTTSVGEKYSSCIARSGMFLPQFNTSRIHPTG